MIRVYLAARFPRRPEMIVCREQLAKVGIEVTSRWLDTEVSEDDGKKRRENAIMDLEDIDRSDCLIMFSDPPGTPNKGGRHTEFGVALALGKQIMIVGEAENVFHSLGEPQIKIVKNWEEAARVLCRVKLISEGVYA